MGIFKKTLIELLVFIAIFVVIVLVLNYFVDEDEDLRIVNAKLAGQELTLEVADNSFLQNIGLSGREYLPENQGMIFVYDEEIDGLSFWMKDTLIPLDMIFLNSEFEVVYIIESVPICDEEPCPTYTSQEKAKYVIELYAGWVEAHNLEEGEVLKFKVQDQSDS